MAIASLQVGKVYIYSRGPDSNWPSLPNFTLNVPVRSQQNSFARRGVSLSKSFALVGLPSDGKAFIFTKAAGIWSADPVQNFTQQPRMFGFCVGITDLYAVVSAYTSNTAYLFRSLSNGRWLETPVQILNEPGIPARFLGHSCALSDYEVILGSYQVGASAQPSFL